MRETLPQSLRSVLDILWAIFRVAALAALGYCALLFVFQRRLLFPAPNQRLPDPLPPGVAYVPLDQGFGLFMNAARHADDRRPVMIFAHGNGELAHYWIDAFEDLMDRGISVLILEYAGYGGAPGSPSLATLRDGALSAYDAMAARTDVDSSQIFAYGRSIGCGAVGLLADRRPLAALALESSFSTLVKLAYEHGYPGFLLRDRFDNLTVLQKLEIPVFLYHGARDDLIPISHAHLLHDAAPHATFIEGACGHNDCPRPWPQLLTFLESAGIPLRSEESEGS